MRTSVKFAAACAGCDGAPSWQLDIGAPTASADAGAVVSVSELSVGVRPVRASATPPWRSPAAPPDASGKGIGNLAIAGTDSPATHRTY